MESVIRVDNGNIAVMGGLMEDTMNNADDTIPGLWKAPVVGGLFTNRNDTNTKTELVIFLRPIVIKDASLEGDYASFRSKLPGNDFFGNNPGPGPVPTWRLGDH